jgi:hypothetical protein
VRLIELHGARRCIDRLASNPFVLGDHLGAEQKHECCDLDAEQRGDGSGQRAVNGLRLLGTFLARDIWRHLVAEGIKSGTDDEFYDASWAADYVGFDTFDFHWQRLVADPSSGGKWYEVMKRANPSRIDQIVQLAEEKIPLGSIATGPAAELGLGKEYAAHSCLDFIVQDLGQFPGKGWKLIDASVRSPVIRNRNMALNALETWGPKEWPPDAKAALTSAAQHEPEDELKKRFEVLLGKLGAGSNA